MKVKICLFVVYLILTTACEKSDPFIPNEEELITTLSYTLTAPERETVVLIFRDQDGEGGNAPSITGGNLVANTTYSGVLDLLNEAEDPQESITEEIMEEKEEHQFFYATTIGDLSISYTDVDDNNQPIGLSTTLVTGAAGSGELTITLRHEPNKNATGVNMGLIENAGGETDIEVTFPINIQ